MCKKMIKYSEHLLSSPLKTSSGYKSSSPTPPSESRHANSAQDNRISLTPLWEYVVRTKSLPEGLDLNVFFQAVEERLRNPEREVRQHALRVLTDFMPVIDSATLDSQMQTIMPLLVANFGHIGPAVRKGAIDCLRMYLSCSQNSDNILKDLVYNGLEKAHENKVKMNVVIGIILGLPFFLPKASHESLLCVIRALLEKMVQITYQEVTLRSLVRIKDALGDKKFDEYIRFSGTGTTRKDFDLLCEVYDVQRKNINEICVEGSPFHNKSYWNDLNQNVLEDGNRRSETEVARREKLGEVIEDKVILETEIKLNSGPAITMQIHEESRQNVVEVTDSEEESRNRLGIVKVLTDDSEEDYEPRRTPRRVRFGGEVVKLRTPDSDSNQQSDLDNDSTITITPRDGGSSDRPLIEIHYTDMKSQRSKSGPAKSHIPVPNPTAKQKEVQSEPSSPQKSTEKKKRKVLFRSSPNLSKVREPFGEKVQNGSSRIPRRSLQMEEVSKTKKDPSHTTTIEIKLTDYRAKPKSKLSELKVAKPTSHKGSQKSEKAVKEDAKKENPKEEKKLPPLKISSAKSGTAQKSDEPSKVHKEIEMLYNLTRSPEEENARPMFDDKGGALKKVDRGKVAQKSTNDNRNLGTADKVLLNRETKPSRSTRNVRTAEQSDKPPDKNQDFGYSSFQVCSTSVSNSDSFRQRIDSPIPTNDQGDCLTCSSSGSDNLMSESSWEDVGIVDKTTINNLNTKDDWKVRLKGLEELSRILQIPNYVEAFEPKAASLLYFLFSCEQHSRLQTAAEDILKILFTKMKTESLERRLNQIVTSLCKMGSPAGVRLSILLMRRISAEEFLDQLLKPAILGAKSSKIREGSLQILMTISRIFPSTEVNATKATEFITPLLRDRKKRVRRASLETLAALAQLATPGVVLDVAVKVSADYPDKEQLIKVVRTRLSRKQLPAVDLNGSVRYSTPSGESEIEWISIGSASSSPQFPQSETPTNANHKDNNIANNNTDIEASNRSDFQAAVQVSNEPEKTNYWKVNARNAESVQTVEGDESDWSANSEDRKVKDDLKSQNLQIWAVDPSTLSTPLKLSPANGTLRPLYIIQREQAPSNSNSSNSSDNYAEKDPRKSTRGRSFSPPKRQLDFANRVEVPERFISLSGHERYASNAPVTRCLHKSSSCDHIRCDGKVFSPSASSTQSGASIRHTNWQKNFKSGIPVPVSSDSRFRLRTRQCYSKGPVSVPPHVYRTKSPSPQHTPNRSLISQRSVLAHQPFSSESDSPDFFTPPAEPHLATNHKPPEEDLILQSPRQSESFIEIDTPRYHNENFTVIDNSAEDVLDSSKPYTEIIESDASETSSQHEAIKIINETLLQRRSSIKSEDFLLQPQAEYQIEEIIHTPTSSIVAQNNDTYQISDETLSDYRPYSRNRTLSNSLENLDKYDSSRNFVENRALSKSEVNLQKVLEVSRKTISSAPASNDVLHHTRENTFDNSLDSTATSIPGAVMEFLPEKETPPPEPVPTITKSVPKTPRTNTVTKPPFSRKNSVRSSKKETTPFTDTVRPFPKAKEGLHETLSLLESSEWEMTMKGLQGILRLTRHHPEVAEANIHNICVALGRHIKNLRSQVARGACLAASELFSNHKKAMEMELEEVAVPLLHRTADTNKFLRSDANAALDKMCLSLAPPRVVAVVATKGGAHHNAIVRCAAARLLCSLTSRLGCEKIFQLPKETRDRILFSGANMLMEGNLETRKHAKMMFGNLSGHCQFNKAMAEAVPVGTMRHIQKTLKSLQ